MKEKKSSNYNGIWSIVLYSGISLLTLLFLFFVVSNFHGFNRLIEIPVTIDHSLTKFLPNVFTQKPNISKFNSCNELANKIIFYDDYAINGSYDLLVTLLTARTSYSPESKHYSTTNVQVKGIDEADLVKTDGEYLYSISNINQILTLNIIKAYPVNEAKLESSITLFQFDIYHPLDNYEFFINNDKLIVIADFYNRYYHDVYAQVKANFSIPRYYDYYSFTIIKIYNISDKRNPVLIDEYTFTMDYQTSRMINDSVYIIMNHLPKKSKIVQDEFDILPLMSENNSEYVPMAKCNEVYFLDDDYISSFIGIVKISLNDNKPTITKEIIAGRADVIYVSYDNIYAISRKYNYFIDKKDVSIIHKLSIKTGNISYVGKAIVPGIVLNQFSVDEYEGNLRIATTSTTYKKTGVFDLPTSNNIYILDENLNLIGKLEELAKGENIHSARFIGNKGYLVTFKKVDPLFVIDLSNPKNPKVLGKLKIPGYSDYLHPINDTLLIGIGKNTVEADKGNFAWYQGLKIALFDVSDYNNPKELSYLEIGDRGTDSEVLINHKAFLYDKRNNLIVIPVLLAKIDESKYSGNVPKWQSGDYVYQGAYLFKITNDNKLTVKGRITHIEDNENFKKSGYYNYPPGKKIKRALYINEYLYTISDKIIKINRIDDLAEVKKIVLLN